MAIQHTGSLLRNQNIRENAGNRLMVMYYYLIYSNILTMYAIYFHI